MDFNQKNQLLLFKLNLTEGVKLHNLKAVSTSADFRKACDSIHHSQMLCILRAYYVPDRVDQAIGLVYDGTCARVLMPDGNTDYFETLAGVLQGNMLTTFPFIIVLDYITRQAIDGKEELSFKLDWRRSRWQHPSVITDTDFADDISLIVEDMNQAQELLTSVKIESGKIGLHLKGNVQFVKNTTFGVWEKMIAQLWKMFCKKPMNTHATNLRMLKHCFILRGD